MSNSIRELVLSNTQTPILDMIPIFIGQQQAYVESVPTFTGSLNSHISLPNDSVNKIDLTSIKLNIKYWKQICPSTTLSNSGNFANIPLTIPIPPLLDTTCIFVIYNNSTGELLFSSTISKINSNATNLTNIKLATPLTLTGFLYSTILKNVTESLPFTLNNLSTDLIPSYDRTYISACYNPGICKVNVSLNKCSISYNLNPNVFTTKYYTNIIAQDGVLKAQQYLYGTNPAGIGLTPIIEANQLIKLGLSYSKNAIVINCGNDAQIQYLFDALDRIANIGYFIVPINLSDFMINTLANYVKNHQVKNEYFSILIPADSNINNNIVYSGNHYA